MACERDRVYFKRRERFQVGSFYFLNLEMNETFIFTFHSLPDHCNKCRDYSPLAK